MRLTLTPTPSNTATPSLTPSNTPSYTPTGTVCPGLTPTATPTTSLTPSITASPTGTINATPTQTSTPTNTPSSTPPGESCTVWKIVNNSFFDVTWSGIICGSETSTGGFITVGQTFYTGCIKDGTLGYTGSPTITVDAIC